MVDPERGEQQLLAIEDPLAPSGLVTDALKALGLIEGEKIERQLIDLARIGGVPIAATAEQTERYATNRLALTDKDTQARNEFIKSLMEEAGLELLEHPLALLGVMQGKIPELEPIVLLSHADTVPNGDMYDGTLGVLGAINAAKAIQDTGIILDRSLIIAVLTGEESSRFNFACFGSQSIFLGLNDKEILSTDSQGLSIADAVGSKKVDIIKQPIFGPKGNQLPTPHAVIELHVSQDKRLEEQELDLAVVDAIAAPARYKVKFGAEEPIEPQETSFAHSRYFDLTVNGRSGHSGATPMTPGARADGLLFTSEFITDFFKSRRFKDNIAIGNIHIDGQAINKIPGITKTSFRISSDDPEEVEEILRTISKQVESYNLIGEDEADNGNRASLEEAEKPDSQAFFDQREVIDRQLSALVFVRAVNAIAADPKLAHENIVGTVGTFNTDNNGVISLGLDIRGTNKTSRDEVVQKLMNTFDMLQVFSSINFGEPLAGSGVPVELSKELVKKARGVIDKYEIGSATTMFSAAGHDAQNAARADIPTVMLFVPSRDGIAHNPNAYTTPHHLEKGVKALAALAIDLAARR